MLAWNSSAMPAENSRINRILKIRPWLWKTVTMTYIWSRSNEELKCQLMPCYVSDLELKGNGRLPQNFRTSNSKIFWQNSDGIETILWTLATIRNPRILVIEPRSSKCPRRYWTSFCATAVDTALTEVGRWSQNFFWQKSVPVEWRWRFMSRIFRKFKRRTFSIFQNEGKIRDV